MRKTILSRWFVRFVGLIIVFPTAILSMIAMVITVGMLNSWDYDDEGNDRPKPNYPLGLVLSMIHY